MDKTETGDAIFGGFDGLTSALGVVAAGVVNGGAPATVFVSAAGLASAAAVSMGGGLWLADENRDDRFRRAITMGTATLIGSAIPALGFLLSRSDGIWFAVISTIAIAHGVACFRPGGRLRSSLQTFGLLFAAAGLSIAVSAALGAVG